MRSMTGFGVGDASLAEGRVVAEVRSVNQRFLDVRARLPRELADLGLFAEQVARERLRRGRVEIAVHTEGSVIAPSVLDEGRARAAFHALAKLRDELAPGAELPLSLLAAVPDLFLSSSGASGPALEAARVALRSAIERAMDAMAAMSLREGEALAADLTARAELVRRAVVEIEANAGTAHEAARRRLRDRIARLVAGAGAADETRLDVELTMATSPPNPGRLEAEIALVADRADVSEELTRLASHLEQLAAAILDSGAEPVGRRLDFLLQEMLREANTISAKAQDAVISRHVITIKVELERMREQIQNVE